MSAMICVTEFSTSLSTLHPLKGCKYRTGRRKSLYRLGPYIITSRRGAMVVNGRQSDGCRFARMCMTEVFKCSEVQYSDLALQRNANIVSTCRQRVWRRAR